MKFYNEIKNEIRNVIEAEENSAAWKLEARNRMKDVNALITAAKKVNKEIEIDAVELVKVIRAEIAAEKEAAQEATDPDAYMSRELDGQEKFPDIPDAQ